MGKILGPQGSTIKRLQEETGAKISVLGKGSMRDKNKVKLITNSDKQDRVEKDFCSVLMINYSKYLLID